MKERLRRVLVTSPPGGGVGYRLSLTIRATRELPPADLQLVVEFATWSVWVLLVVLEPPGHLVVQHVKKPGERQSSYVDAASGVVAVKLVPASWLSDPVDDAASDSVGRSPYSSKSHCVIRVIFW